MIERRMAEREKVALSVEYDLGAFAGEDWEKIYRAEAQDVCANGLSIVTDHPLKKGSILKLNFPVAGPVVYIPVFAEVAWSVPAQDRFRAGLRFLK